MSFPLLPWDVAASFLTSWNWELRVICFLVWGTPAFPHTRGNHRLLRYPSVLKTWYGATFSILWGENSCYKNIITFWSFHQTTECAESFYFNWSCNTKCAFPFSSYKITTVYPFHPIIYSVQSVSIPFCHLFNSICLASRHARHCVKHYTNNGGRTQILPSALKEFAQGGERHARVHTHTLTKPRR